MINVRNILSLVGFLIVVFLLYTVFFKTPSKPWEESGHFVLAVRAVPGTKNESVLGLGIDNFRLYRQNGETESVTVLTRRVTLDPSDSSIVVLLDTLVPEGEYSGFDFVLKSPELRNTWEEEDAPDVVALLNENIHLKVPYTIQKDVTSSVVLSFETLRAIHTDNDEKKYLPVIQVETRGDTTLGGGESEPVTIEGGDILHLITFGMDWDGTMRHNFRAKKKVVEVEEIPPITQETSTTSTQIDTFEDEVINEESATSSALEEG